MRVLFSTLILALLLTGCVANLDVPDESSLKAADQRLESWEYAHTFDGEFLLGGPDAREVFPFEVPEGTGEVEALLTWDAPDARLGFRLIDPSGEEVASGWHEGSGRAYVTTTHPPVAGEWKVEVEADSGAGVRFEMGVTTREVAEAHGPIERTFTVPARNAARDLPDGVRGEAYRLLPRDFAEVNLNMVPGDFFNYTWTASEEVYFNVHYHGENGTERPIETRASTHEGTFTADRTEVYALLWRNEGLQPVEVTVRMEGAYRLHSMTREG